MADTPKRPAKTSKPQTAAEKKQERARKRAAKKEARRWYWTVLKYGSLTVGGVIVVILGAGTGYAASLLKGLPKISANTFTNMNQSSIVLARDGKTVIGRFDAQGNRDPISSLNEVSSNLTNALVSAEDKTFWTNPGINPLAMGRAFVQDLMHHQIQSGASTITQETVKLAVFPAQERTTKRKVQEIALALKLNQMLTKQEIMVDYMNWIYFGHLGNNPVYGVKAASKILFGKDPKDLNLAESAVLASIPNNPSIFDPYQYDVKNNKWVVNVTNVTQREHYILQQMLKNGYITQSQYNDAMNFDIAKDLQNPNTQSGSTAKGPYTYLMQDEIPLLVSQDLVKAGVYPSTQAADAALSTAGLKIYTTIDPYDQKLVTKVMNEPKWYQGANIPYGKGVDRFELGFTLEDNATGQILAVGGGNSKNSIDHSDVPEQTGSSIKPLIDYGPAIDEHKLNAASVLDDAPIQWYNNGKAHDDEPGWRGIVTARTALVQSYNIPAIEVLRNIGVQNGESYLPKMGITNNSLTIDGQRTWVAIPTKQTHWSDDVNLSSAIGGLTYGLTVQQMTGAYSTFANGGVWKSPYMISKIEDNNGETLYKSQQTVNRVFSPQATYVLNSILRQVVTQGTAAYGVGNEFPSNEMVYGKTGTTDSLEDGWFMGFTKTYTAGIWEGYDIPEPIANSLYNTKFFMWSEIMKGLVAQSDHSAFQQPSGIVNAAVCKVSGMAPSKLCKQQGLVNSDIFIAGTEPTKPDTAVEQLPYVVLNGKKYLATTNTPPDQIKIGIFYNPPWKLIPTDYQAANNHYPPEYPDPRGGTVLPPLSSDTVVQPPSPPAGLTGSVNGGQVQLSWSGVSSATGYTVWRATSPNGPFTQLTPNPIPDTAFTDSSIPSSAGIVYYEVMAISSTTGSSKPATVAVQVQTSPVPPTGNQTGNTTP